MIYNNKICIVTEEFKPSKKGGIATWSHGLANYFVKEGYLVTVFVKKRGGIDSSIKNQKKPYKIKLMSGIDWPFFKKWYVQFSIKSYIKKNKNPVIISSNWELSEGIIKHKKKYKFSLITVLHGLEVTRLFSKKYLKRKKNFIKTIDLSDETISVSNYTKNEALKINNKKKIHVIPNFVDTKEFYPLDRISLLKKYNINSNMKIILSLSRLNRRKGHRYVIKSLKYLKNKLPNFKYLIAGTGNLKYKKELQMLSKKMNLEKNIVFLDYINENEKNNLYNICDVYIMNSLPTDINGDSEGFGITFLEANACAKPVVGTNVGGISDAIDNGLNGLLVEPNNAKATFSALDKILNNDEYYKFLSSNALIRSKKKFEINKVCKKYKIIINKLNDFQ